MTVFVKPLQNKFSETSMFILHKSLEVSETARCIKYLFIFIIREKNVVMSDSNIYLIVSLISQQNIGRYKTFLFVCPFLKQVFLIYPVKFLAFLSFQFSFSYHTNIFIFRGTGSLMCIKLYLTTS